MNLADNLKRIRKENNLSQEQLAEKLGVSRQAVSKWESGQSYPEMDKVIQICTIFNLNMNELVNKDLREEKEEKNLTNKYITSFFDYLTKVVNMFSSMKPKQIIGCLIEQFIIIFILLMIIVLIGSIGAEIVPDILMSILPNNLYRFIFGIIKAIYFIASGIAGVSIFLHIFKVRYLDYYEFVTYEDKNQSTNEKDITEEENTEDEKMAEETSNDNNKIILEKKKEKIVIRDPKNANFNFFAGLGKVLLFIAKFFISWVLLFFVIWFIAMITCLAMSFLFIKTGLLFIGFLIAIIGCISLCAILIELMYNFIFNRKNSKTRIFIIGIISLIGIGLGTGLCFVGISDFDIIEQNDDLVSNEYIFKMQDNLMVSRLYNYYNTVEYVEENREDVRIVVEHSKYYTTSLEEEDGFIYIYDYVEDEEITKLIRLFIKDFNNKKITTYSGEHKIIVYASKENIENMKNNRKEYFNNVDRINKLLEDSRKEYDRLKTDNELLESILEDNNYIIVKDSNDRIIDIYINEDEN